MNISYYTGVSAMRAFQDELGVTANNIANVNTTGYKPQKSSFGDLLYTQMDTRSADLLVGHGVRNTGVESTFVQGSFEQTGRELDFAISGKAYFAVEVNEEDEEPAYTRDGSFMISATDDGNYLVTRDGYYVLGPEGERIELEYKTAKDENGREKETAELDLSNLKEQIGLYSCENPDGLIPVGDNLFRSGETSGEWVSQADMDDSAVTSKILSKTLERSMTMVSTEMINLVEAQRAFQLSSRVVSAADEMENIINTLR